MIDTRQLNKALKRFLKEEFLKQSRDIFCNYTDKYQRNIINLSSNNDKNLTNETINDKLKENVILLIASPYSVSINSHYCGVAIKEREPQPRLNSTGERLLSVHD